MELDNSGVRSSVIIDVLELGESGLNTVATWKANGLDRTERLTINRDRIMIKTNAIDDENSMRKKTLKVITTLVNKSDLDQYKRLNLFTINVDFKLESLIATYIFHSFFFVCTLR